MSDKGTGPHPAAQDGTLVRIRKLTRVFDVSKPWLNRVIERLPRARLTAVSDVSFDIPERGVYALVGESGSGKSTIGKMVVGLLDPSEGEVRVRDVDLASETDAAKVAAARSEIQMIFQDPYASLNPRWRVRDIIAEPVAARGGDTRGLAERLLEQVGLAAEDAVKYPHEFSGGQRQRICIARALAANPKLIVCDEPTSALDVSVQAQVLNLMSDLREEYGLTYLFISHDLTVVQHMADTIGVLYLGRLVEEAASDALFETPRHPYTQMLFAAAPRMDAYGREVEPPKGEIPDPINPPAGCAFHPRCPIAVARCKSERPEMRRVGGARVACHLAE
ncbi:ABC transporter ATP-binding protein [Meridianimarinicoccus roseus]|uniref:ABC transporter ATP-binding protein n=1 Tax=Meridianimarinicoccus roseus TaxID=2072018 RepID=A0A2V2LE77_9RHOB|nr:oligopeptide/dipeptide ABC transporter ATP-binding protein [Meridianimarinicoccus roseus]PWR01556.1 ABC transporter ATP-binding protein [Meridianimarinicoccus roseus]